ncbi:MAG: dolichyl-P-Man:Man(5)GlcNAc(2)-PP-dolichol alpha-1,3-mannosyltransferase [Candelina submexicana]|nr:MAG: dolichyl-P-Man:Man(5)GlcNAc(2)-PP-dolichol alpha-1,3-mannosyltransferase [Candelina submexicana]
MNLVQEGMGLATDRKHTRWLAPALLAVDAVLCALIIWKIPYTEIDWKAYMEQVEQYHQGERDYTTIKGGTGPLVYPAAHVYIYSALYHITDRGHNILLAQTIFAVLYLAILVVVMACYRLAKAPPYIFPLLILSKRLHSIFLLRLFNDCFTVGALFVAIYAYQQRMWTAGSVFYALGLGVKMSLLLVLPAIGIVLLQAVSAGRAVRQAMLIGQVQLLLASPFLPKNAIGYLSRAFDFSRQFLFKWTVNWKFIGEEAFLSRPFSISLLLAHLVILLLFTSTRWIKPSRRSFPDVIRMAIHSPTPEAQTLISSRVKADFVLTTFLTANAIGMLCARSLHYQFYSWIAWATPFLLWRAGYHPVVQYTLWAAQEWAWNVYPSTPASSGVVVGVLLLTVVGVFWGTGKDATNEATGRTPTSAEHRHVE